MKKIVLLLLMLRTSTVHGFYVSGKHYTNHNCSGPGTAFGHEQSVPAYGNYINWGTLVSSFGTGVCTSEKVTFNHSHCTNHLCKEKDTSKPSHQFIYKRSEFDKRAQYKCKLVIFILS